MMDEKKLTIERGILDLIEQDGRVTQTELSRSLRVSIGLVNAYLKNLINKGYVKVSNVKSSTIKYMLTAEGLTEKYRLTRSYMGKSLDFYRHIKQAVESRIMRLKLEEVRSVVFVGNGEIAEIMYLYLGDTKIELLDLFEIESSPEKRFFDYQVKDLNELPTYVKTHKVDKILLNFFEEVEDVEKRLVSMGIDPNIIDSKW